LRDPRRYGIENTTDKVRRRGAVRRRRDAVCTERIVGHSDIGRERRSRRMAPVTQWQSQREHNRTSRSFGSFSAGSVFFVGLPRLGSLPVAKRTCRS
jgi:hypothetical protein